MCSSSGFNKQFVPQQITSFTFTGCLLKCHLADGWRRRVWYLELFPCQCERVGAPQPVNWSSSVFLSIKLLPPPSRRLRGIKWPVSHRPSFQRFHVFTLCTSDVSCWCFHLLRWCAAFVVASGDLDVLAVAKKKRRKALKLLRGVLYRDTATLSVVQPGSTFGICSFKRKWRVFFTSKSIQYESIWLKGISSQRMLWEPFIFYRSEHFQVHARYMLQSARSALPHHVTQFIKNLTSPDPWSLRDQIIVNDNTWWIPSKYAGIYELRRVNDPAQVI